jgi:DNA repair protein RecO (recombination protein O)
MLLTLQGIILRTVKYSESSIICDIYSREYGLRSYIVSGVRQQKSRVSPALIKSMNWVEMVVYHREDKEINRVKEIKSAFIYKKIPFDIIRASIGIFMTELAQKSIKESVSNPELYDFLYYSFTFLDSMEGKLNNYHLSFMVKLTQYLGFMPEAEEYFETENDLYFDYQNGIFISDRGAHIYCFSAFHSKVFLQLIEMSMEESGQIKMTAESRMIFIEDLIRFYQYHIEKLHLNAHDVLHQVLS